MRNRTERWEREYRGEKITAMVTFLDCGAHVLLTGGGRTHVGAVSCAGYGEDFSRQFPGHREEIVSRMWARELSEAWGEPVTVACGIHYDAASRQEIDEIVGLCRDLLRDVKRSRPETG